MIARIRRRRRFGRNHIVSVVQKDYCDLQNHFDIMTRQQVLDLYFVDARHKLIDLAAFLDRVDRAAGQDDFRVRAFRKAISKLGSRNRQKARQVLLAFSDPTTKPAAKAAGKGASGAWRPERR